MLAIAEQFPGMLDGLTIDRMTPDQRDVFAAYGEAKAAIMKVKKDA